MIRDYGKFEKHFYKKEAAAMKAAKKRYDYKCVLSGSNMTVDGCHIYPRSTYPALRYCDLNIVPITPKLHTGSDDTFDWIKYNLEERTVDDKIKHLENAHFPFIAIQLALLRDCIRELEL
jgi:hypothetical protein